ncbi:MAG: hypothetical protein ACE5RP_00085 [Nitrosopumilus sp.]
MRQGMYPKQIAEELFSSYKYPKQSLQRYITILKKNNVIEKRGYGVWDIDNKAFKNFMESEYKRGYVHKHNNDQYEENTARGHGFQITLKLPGKLLKNEKRSLLNRRKIDWLPSDHVTWQGEKIVMDYWTIVFAQNSILFSFSEDMSIYGENAKYTFIEMMYIFKRTIRKLEKLFSTSFKKTTRHGKAYNFRVTKEHYALIKNLDAKYLNDEKHKLFVYNEEGELWLLVDHSHNEDELELVQAGKALSHEDKMRNHYNSIKDTSMDYYKVLDMFGKTENQIQSLNSSWEKYAKDMEFFAENQATHVGSIKTLGTGVKDMTNVIKEMTSAIYELKGIVSNTSANKLNLLKEKIHCTEDMLKYQDEISELSENERFELSEWTFKKLGR